MSCSPIMVVNHAAGRAFPVEPLRWTDDGKVVCAFPTGVSAPVSIFRLSHCEGREALARALRELPS